MGLRNLMLKKTEMADNGLELTVFCQQDSSVTKPSAVTCKNVTRLSSFMNYWDTAQDIYFPNVQSIDYEAFTHSFIYKGTLHFDVNYKAAITKTSGYPSFDSWTGSPTYAFDINGVKLTLDKPSDVTNVWVNDFAVTDSYDWIPKSKDVSIVALADSAILIDTVNTATDLTYTLTMPTTNPVGINVTDADGTASSTIKYGTRTLMTKTGLNPYLYAPSGTTLNYDMLLTTSDGDFYTYAGDLSSLLSITMSDMEKRSTFFKYGGSTYYVTDTLTTFDELYSWIQTNYSSTYASNMTELYDSSIETLSTTKLQNNNYLRVVYLSKCTSVGDSAFYSCYRLKTVDLPKCTSVGASAFYGCSYLATVNMPECTSIGNSAFSSCYELKTVDLPKCTSVGATAFYNSHLVTVSLPECTSVGNSAFYQCNFLETVDLPKCTSIGPYAFQYCSNNAIDFNLPLCESIGAKAFYSCYRLKTLNLPACTNIASDAFNGCDSLTVHFAAANQATIEALAGYSSRFGAHAIYFDL